MKKVRSIFFIIEFWILMVLVWVLTFFGYILLIKHLKRAGSRKKNKPKILYLEVFPEENAGYHYRSKKWAQTLNEQDLQTTIKTIFTRDRFNWLLQNNFLRFIRIMQWKRLIQVLSAWKYDLVIVRRELLLYNDYGNLFLERLLMSIHPNTVLDFDDDISAAKSEPRSISTFGKVLLESPVKFRKSLVLYNNFIVGSKYLRSMVEQVNPSANIEVIPTCVDYTKHSPVQYPAEPPQEWRIGWIGSNTNQFYLNDIEDHLNRLAEEFNIRLCVISGQKFEPETPLKFPVDYIPWSLQHEVGTLKTLHIGVMPLRKSPIVLGKCGFKLIQYMGLGIISVATDVPFNSELISDEENGYLVEEPEDWYSILKKAIQGYPAAQSISKNARATIRSHYSFDANRNKYVSFLVKIMHG